MSNIVQQFIPGLPIIKMIGIDYRKIAAYQAPPPHAKMRRMGRFIRSKRHNA
jgi:hypothetical protein